MHKVGLWLVLLLLSGNSNAVPSSTLHLGVLEWRDSVIPAGYWQPTLAAIGRQLPNHQVVLHPLNLQELEVALAAGQLDFVMTNPGHYVQLSQHYPLAPLATLRNPAFDPPQQAVGSVLIVAAESAVQQWRDLRNRRVAAVHPEAFGGFQLIWDQLEHHGLNLQRDVGEWIFTGYPMEALLDRLNTGEVDAVVLRSCLLESLAAEGRLDLQDYRVIGKRQMAGYPCQLSSDLYPDWPFLSTGRQPTEVVQQIALALLQMPDTPENRSQWSTPLSYQPVYQLFERLRVGPYAAFPRNPLLALLHQYRYLLLVLAGLMILFLIHHLRVSHLVRLRTHELQLLMHEQQQKKAELAHLSRISMMGELAAGLAHELNQPLTASMNYAQGMLRLLDKPATGQQEAEGSRLRDAASRIVAQSERAAGIIRNLRGFLRKELPAKENLDINLLLEEALLLTEPDIRARQVQIHLQLPPSPSLVHGNRIELLQLFINLLNNALDAMQNTSLAARNLDITCEQQQHCWVISIKDQGEGIAADVAAHLFDPFFTTRRNGMGLGLKLCQTLVRSHGGSLTLTNRPEAGAVARIELPQLKT
ncbi:MAG: PhnD/SsuA/transferrin family substrate-binding protein [Marinospirillum sp.]|uniref:sensor histidine kinase n=1 Tax=Marinospirillum sp. TaxID=2183934 RepID=UPI0019F8BB9F|nr:sensor histidine kinase [Marinospirillum sp.]MBE0508637.1 PhnD/SsuA/transferrin family substrate-binding protein [Marinospirillum sp.]